MVTRNRRALAHSLLCRTSPALPLTRRAWLFDMTTRVSTANGRVREAGGQWWLEPEDRHGSKACEDQGRAECPPSPFAPAQVHWMSAVRFRCACFACWLALWARPARSLAAFLCDGRVKVKCRSARQLGSAAYAMIASEFVKKLPNLYQSCGYHSHDVM